MNYEQEYNRVMGLLRNTKMPHGLCEPRDRKACTHCNAVEKLDELIEGYKGARIVLAEAQSSPRAGTLTFDEWYAKPASGFPLPISATQKDYMRAAYNAALAAATAERTPLTTDGRTKQNGAD